MSAEIPVQEYPRVDTWQLDPELPKCGRVYLPKGKQPAKPPSNDAINHAIDMVYRDGDWYKGPPAPKKLRHPSWKGTKKTDEDEETIDPLNDRNIDPVNDYELRIIEMLSVSTIDFGEQMLRLKDRDKTLIQDIGWMQVSIDNRPVQGDAPELAAAKAARKAQVDLLLSARYDLIACKTYYDKICARRIELGRWTKPQTKEQTEEAEKQFLIKRGILDDPELEAYNERKRKESYDILLPYMTGKKKFQKQTYKWTVTDDEEERFGGFSAPFSAKPTDGAGPSVVAGAAAAARK
jgi:hypothetical protein